MQDDGPVIANPAKGEPITGRKLRPLARLDDLEVRQLRRSGLGLSHDFEERRELLAGE